MLNSSEIKQTNVLQLRRFQNVPANLDLSRLSDDERDMYGFPPTDSNASLDSYILEKLKRFTLREPQFEPRVSDFAAVAAFSAGAGVETRPTWSGGVTFPAVNETFAFVEGTWTLPQIAAPQGPAGGQVIASVWTGIDGDGISQDVLQAGIDINGTSANGNFEQSMRAWLQWYPGASQAISNFPISPADIVNVSIRVAPNASNSASIFVGNVTTKIGMHFGATAAPGVALVGNCAEWIVEAPIGLPLAQFGRVEFTGCSAQTSDGHTVGLQSGNAINMVSNNRILATSQIVGPAEVLVQST